jgi:hypothetical protein
MASRTIIDASAGGSIIELTLTQAFTLFKKVTDNDTWASSERLLLVQPTRNVKGVLQVEKEDILEGKIDSLMRRLEKMEIEKKEALPKQDPHVKSAENMAMSTRIVRRKPRCSTTLGREICRTSATGKVDLNFMQAHPF